MFVALAGIAAGLVHVLSGPDHLAAVAPLVAGQTNGQWRTGLRWGLGHTAGVLLIGLLMIALRGFLPVDALSAYSERVIGVVLLGVGAWAFVRARSPRPRSWSAASGSWFENDAYAHPRYRRGDPRDGRRLRARRPHRAGDSVGAR